MVADEEDVMIKPDELKVKTTQENGLYIMLLSIHGLIRGDEPELGRDPDTGGQTLYVIELAKALGEREDISQVDLVTRRIVDSKIDKIYQQRYENLNEKSRIVRFHFGPRRYLRKESLWPYLDAMTDRIVQHLREQRRIPDIIHGHYADAGYVGAQLAHILGVPFVFTGHSLGRDKKRRLLEQGKTDDFLEKKFKIERRIEAEEHALESAGLVITSTKQEQEVQYEAYDRYSPKTMRIIPPGVDLSLFKPPPRAIIKSPIIKDISRFLRNDRKPIVLAISRADERKNIISLIKAFGENIQLNNIANLVIIAGNRENLNDLSKSSRVVIQHIFELVDQYNLYGKCAYPKQHRREDIPDIYQYTAQTGGVFVNPAFIEPFGLTLLEASASGLPLLATDDGGPQDIIANCENGRLFDPLNTVNLGYLLLDAIEDRKQWKNWQKKGLRNVHKYYSWLNHANSYVKEVKRILKSTRLKKTYMTKKSKLPTAEKFIICDIDNTLIGDQTSVNKLMRMIENQGDTIGFGIATGRRVTSALNILKKWDVRKPDFLICCVGTEIYYKNESITDRSWQQNLLYRWYPEQIREVISKLSGLELQSPLEQRKFKISYNLDSKYAPTSRELEKYLRNNGLSANVIYSHDAYVDILPIRASKGLAVHHLAWKWSVPLEQILVAGDSGNDAEMLLGDSLGVVVGNYSKELEYLKGQDRIHFSDGEYAQGIIEGIKHYDFFSDKKYPDEYYAE